MKRALLTALVGAIAVSGIAAQGRTMMMQGGRGGSLLAILQRADVQKELGLTSEQKSKIEALSEQVREEMRARFEEMRANGGGTQMTPQQQEANIRFFREQQEKQEKELGAILSPEQLKRAKELSLQRMGVRAVLNPNVATQLGITEDQKKQLQELMRKQAEANRQVMERVQSGEIDRDQLREIFQKNERILDEEIGKILSQAQKDKLKELAGKPFAFVEGDGR